jgi:prolyl oligopeptidase PreP (S9A serine peptidase family)
LQYNQKYALASDGMKIPIFMQKQSHNPMTLHVAGVFNLIYLGKHSKSISIAVEKV